MSYDENSRTITTSDGHVIRVTDNPNYKPPDPSTLPPPPPGKLDAVDKVTGKTGAAVGMLAAGTKLLGWLHGKPGILGDGPFETIAHWLMKHPAFSKVLGGVGVGISAYSAFRGYQQRFKNGFKASDSLSIGMEVLGLWMSLSALLPGGPLTALVAALIIEGLMALLAAIFGLKDRDANKPEIALKDIPVYVSDWPVVLITGGLVMNSAAFGFFPDMPKYSRPVAYATLQTGLTNATLERGDGDIQPENFTNAQYYRSNRTRPVYVRKGGLTGPDFVMLVTEENSRQDRTTAYTIKDKFRFTAPAADKPYYLSLFSKKPNGEHKVNQDVLGGVQAGNAVAKSAPYLSGGRGATAMQITGALNKEGEAASD